MAIILHRESWTYKNSGEPFYAKLISDGENPLGTNPKVILYFSTLGGNSKTIEMSVTLNELKNMISEFTNIQFIRLNLKKLT